MKQNGFVKGAFILILFNLIGKVIGAVYRIPLANLLGSVGIGEYQLVFPLYSLMLSISVSGIPVAISKLVSEYNSKCLHGDVRRLIKIAFCYLIGVSAVCVALLVVGAKFIAKIQGNSEIYLCYYGIAPAILFVALLSVFRGYFQGHLNMVPTALSGLIEQIGRLVFGLLLARRFAIFGSVYGVLGAVVGISISELIALIFLGVYYIFHSRKSLGNNKPMFKTKAISRCLIQTALPITLGGIASPITSIIDSLLVVNLLMFVGFGSDHATSLLGLQSGIVDPLINIPIVIAISVSSSMLPNLTNVYVKNDKAEVKTLIEKAFQITLSVVLACSICYVIFGRQVLEFLYSRTLSGEELVISTKLLLLGGINLIFLSLVYISSSILQAVGKQRQAARSILIGSAIKILLTIILVSVKEINILGAMISGGMSYFAVFFINFKNIKKTCEFDMTKLIFNVAIQECFVCLFAFLANWLLNFRFGSEIALFAGGSVAVLVFVLTYYFLFFEKKSKKISSWLIRFNLILLWYEFKDIKFRIKIKCSFSSDGRIYWYCF